MDELWTFIQKKQNCDDSDKNGVGDLLVYTVVKSDSGLFVAHCCGKRTDKTCNQLLNLVFERFRLPSQTEKILITTDGNPQCANSLVDLYCEPCIDYGQMIKNKKNNRLVDVIRVKIMGNPEIDLKSTSVVEGYNYRIRQRISKFGRKTASFSKKGASCIDALNLFQFMNNFIDLKRNRKTPAMIEGITDHVWSWMEFISYHIQL